MPSQNERQFTELLEFLQQEFGGARPFCRSIQLEKSLFNRLVNGKAARLDPAVIAKINTGTGGRFGMPEFAAYYARLALQDAA